MDHKHDHGMMMAPPPSSSSSSSSKGNDMKTMHVHDQSMMSHMTFYWGKDGEILFSGWPGANTAMYGVALAIIFLLALLVEWLAGSRLAKAGGKGGAGCIFRTFVHALRMGLAYLLMLAVMSFNVGIFLVVILGHAIGYWVFGSSHTGSDDPGFPH